MRKRRPNESWPPGDGWVVLRPGEWVLFHEDTPFSPNLAELHTVIHRLRGGILADAFGIENEMILLRLAEEFGQNDASVVGQRYRDRESAYRAQTGFGKLVDHIKPILRTHLSKTDADRLIQELAKTKKLRDMFAHYPSWIEPINDASKNRTIGLKAFISDKSHVYEIDQKHLSAWTKSAAAARMGVENLRRSIIGAQPLEADGSFPQPAGPVVHPRMEGELRSLIRRLRWAFSNIRWRSSAL